jgi:hypothetical protein
VPVCRVRLQAGEQVSAARWWSGRWVDADQARGKCGRCGTIAGPFVWLGKLNTLVWLCSDCEAAAPAIERETQLIEWLQASAESREGVTPHPQTSLSQHHDV